jgi:hypothetical protein
VPAPLLASCRAELEALRWPGVSDRGAVNAENYLVIRAGKEAHAAYARLLGAALAVLRWADPDYPWTAVALTRNHGRRAREAILRAPRRNKQRKHKVTTLGYSKLGVRILHRPKMNAPSKLLLVLCSSATTRDRKPSPSSGLTRRSSRAAPQTRP